MLQVQTQPIKVHTLGHFDVVKDNRSLVTANASAKKIWELYKFMLTHREQPFTPEALIDQLWVAEDYQDPRATLRRQMHRLRKILEESAEQDKTGETLTFEGGYYRWNTNVPMEIDAEVFEALVHQAENTADADAALSYYLEALQLYRGDYLPDCVEQHWVFSVRYHYRRIYLRAVTGAIELLKCGAKHDVVIDICQKAMKVDVYEEPFHIYYMEALAARGAHKQALEHYEHITGFFYREMGIKPSEEMKAVYKTLLKTNKGENVFEALDQSAPIDNAFYCDKEVFKSIFELERRRSERSGIDFSIAVIELKPTRTQSLAQGELRFKLLKDHLMTHLRKGDSFTQWDDKQLALLLPGVDSPLMQKVLTRVLSTFKGNEDVKISKIEHLAAK